MFSKRHYEKVAEAMQEAWRSLDNDPGQAAGVSTAQRELADMFARDNAAFNRDRFLAACEPGANVKARTRYSVKNNPNRGGYETV